MNLNKVLTSFFCILWVVFVFSAIANEDLSDLLLFEVHLDQSILDDGLNAYREGKLIFFPLESLSHQLTISINVNIEQKKAMGFIISENRSFLLDLNAMTVSISGKTSIVDPKLIRTQQNEIYIESSLYSQWFPVDFTIDTGELILQITTRDELPIQAKLKREKLAREIQENEKNDVGFSNVDTPYSMIDLPFIDQTIEGSITAPPNHPNYGTSSYTTLIVGDMLGMETNLLLNGRDGKALDQHRITMGRNDPDARLLGPFKARSFSFGNITMPTMNYVAHANTTGTGLFLSNRPLSKPALFDKHNFDGVLLPGWDVELFHNGVLIDRQNATPAARYQFSDIPLLYGNNDFKLIFHGPLGQLKEEKYRFQLEDSMVLPGDRYYTLAHSEFDNGCTRTSAQFDQSISPRLSLAIGLLTSNELTHQQDFSRKSYLNFGLRAYWESLFLSGDIIKDYKEGMLGAVGLKTGFGQMSLSLTHALLNNFTSEDFRPSSDPSIMLTTLRADTFLPFGIPLTLESDRFQQKSGIQHYDLSGKASTSILGMITSNKLLYQFTGSASTTTGDLLLSGRLGKWNLRGSFNYNIAPTIHGAGIDLSGDIIINQFYNFTSNLSSDLIHHQMRADFGINKGIGDFGYGVSVGGTSSGEKTVAIRFNAGLGIEPRSSTIFTDARPMGSTGTASVRVFLDKNRNGVMDENDTPISGVGFRIDGGQDPARTNEKGVVLLTHLPTQQRVHLALDRLSIEDPQLTPRQQGVRLLPRPGKFATLEFPIITTTEIDGTLTMDDGDKIKPAEGIGLELVDFINRNQVISSTKTAHDGFYILTEVPPGQYVLRVAIEKSSNLKFMSSELKTIRIPENSGFISGVDLVMQIPTRKIRIEGTPLPKS